MPVKSILSKAFVAVDKAQGKIFSNFNHQTPSSLSNRLIEIGYKLDDRNTLATYKKGVQHAQRENWTEALNAYQDTLQCKQPPPFSFYHHYGLTLLNVGAEVMAKQAFQMSLYYLPDAYWSAYELGKIHLKSAQYSEAAKCFRHVIKHSSECDRAYLYLADSLLAQGAKQYGDEVIELYLEFSERRPNDPVGYCSLKESAVFSKLVQPKHLSRVEKLTRKYPDAIYPKWLLAWIKSQQLQSKAAASLFQEVSKSHLRLQKPEIEDFIYSSYPPLPPSFMFLGPTCSGSSNLFDWLSQHSQIAPPMQQEIDFFSRFYDCGFEWYESHFPRVNQNAGLISCESSSSYFQYAKQATVLIEKYPKIKFIVLYRNPVKRAHSDFYMQKRKGFHNKSWSETVRLELEQLNGKLPSKEVDFSQTTSLLAHSCILPQLQQWLEVVPAEQMLVLKSEEMFASPQRAVDLVTRFLDLERFELSEFKNTNLDNNRPMSAKLEKYLTSWFEPHERELESFLQEHQLTKLPQDRSSIKV